MAVDTLDPNLLASGKKATPPPLNAPRTRGQKAAKMAAYVGIFLAAFLFFFYLKTPSSLVQGIVLNTLNQGGAMQWQADSVSSRILLLPHINAENLSVSSTRDAFPTFSFDEIRIFPSLFSLVPWTGHMNPAFSFDGTAYKAKFSGKAWPNTPALYLTLENLDLTQLTPLVENGAHMKGVVSDLNADVSLDGNRLSHASGTVALKGKNFVVDPSAFQLPLPLPILDLGALDIQARADKGKVTLEKVSVGSPGRDLEVRASGTIQLSDNIQFSRMDLHLRLKPSPKILAAMPSLKTMLETVAALQGDGFYATRLSGTFAQPGLPQPDR
jgi:type II secretion system protein N